MKLKKKKKNPKAQKNNNPARACLSARAASINDTSISSLPDRAGSSSQQGQVAAEPFLPWACPALLPRSPSPLKSPGSAPLPGTSWLCNHCRSRHTPTWALPGSLVFTFWLRGEFHSEETAFVSQPSLGKAALGRSSVIQKGREGGVVAGGGERLAGLAQPRAFRIHARRLSCVLSV